MAGTRHDNRRHHVAVPAGAYLLALLLLAVAVPSALRPPPDPANTSAEFSPDAPPDEQEQIIAALSRAKTGTAGSGEGEGSDGTALGGPNATPSPPPTPRGCPRGIGNPPRQTESLYSAPCAPAFVGDNGGATYKGVTRDQVRVGVVTCSYEASKDGEVSDDPANDGNAVDRTIRVYAAYLNQSFQFYGRSLRFYFAKPSACDDQGLRAAVAMLEDEYQIAVLLSEQDQAHEEGVRRGLITTASYQQSEDWYRKAYPYDFSWSMDGTKVVRLVTEFMCKQLVGRPVQFTIPPLQGRERVFGAIVQGAGAVNELRHDQFFQEMCGQRYARIIHTDPQGSETERLASMVLQLRSEGVTDVVCFCSWNFLTVFTRVATSQSYYPEWVVTGWREVDNNFLATTFDSSQWSHALGIFTKEMPMAPGRTDWMRAYKSIDPEGSPDFTVGRFGYAHLLQLANAIQLAGPELTPENLMAGLMRMPRRPPDPLWAVAGGYAPGDYTYSDYVGLVWWDPDAQDPDVGAAGAYRFVAGGKRFTEGEIPSEPLLFFRDGITTPPPR